MGLIFIFSQISGLKVAMMRTSFFFFLTHSSKLWSWDQPQKFWVLSGTPIPNCTEVEPKYLKLTGAGKVGVPFLTQTGASTEHVSSLRRKRVPLILRGLRGQGYKRGQTDSETNRPTKPFRKEGQPRGRTEPLQKEEQPRGRTEPLRKEEQPGQN